MVRQLWEALVGKDARRGEWISMPGPVPVKRGRERRELHLMAMEGGVQLDV